MVEKEQIIKNQMCKIPPLCKKGGVSIEGFCIGLLLDDDMINNNCSPNSG
jgi:hypothetical protein